MTLALTVTAAALGQSTYPPIGAPPADRPAVPLEQAADVIVVLVPDETFSPLTMNPSRHEKIVSGTIARLEKGPVPATIVITPGSFGNPMHAGVPIRLFLKKFQDRDVYYLIGSHPNVSPAN